MKSENKGAYRPIYTSIWDDHEFREFDNDTKVLFFNLRTTRYGNWPCIYVCYPEMIAAQTKMTNNQILKSLKVLEKADWVIYRPPIVWVKKALKNDPNFYPDNPKHVAGISNLLKTLPKSPLVKQFVEFYRLPIEVRDIDTPIDTPIDTTDTKTDTDTDTDMFVALWHENCPSLPKCLRITSKRRKHIRARMCEHSLEDWKGIMHRIENSDFCKGHGNRGWVATFDWLISSPDTAIKILEGKYDNRTTREPPEPGSPGYAKWAEEMEKRTKEERDRNVPALR